MKIILQKPVDKLGNPGDVTEVADGYARNYLIPRGLAIKAEKGALKHADTLARGHRNRLSKQKGEYEALDLVEQRRFRCERGTSPIPVVGPIRLDDQGGHEQRNRPQASSWPGAGRGKASDEPGAEQADHVVTARGSQCGCRHGHRCGGGRSPTSASAN